MIGGEIAQAAAARAPFVEVAHQHGRGLAVALVQMGEDRLRLLPAPEAAEIEMHADHAQQHAVDADVGEHGAARLQRRQPEQVMLEHLDILADQQRVAVPADAAFTSVDLDRLIVAMRLQHRQRDRARPRAEAPVRLLQRDHVGAELVQHLDRALGPPPPVGADRFPHIVGGDADHRRRL